VRITLSILLVLFGVSTLRAAEGLPFPEAGINLARFTPDTTQTDTAAGAHKAIVDTNLVRDTTVSADTSATKAAIDTVVTYSAADSIVYSISTRQMMLYKKGDMKYRDFKLDAGHISINWDTSILTAEGTKDTADKTIEQPIFSQGGETYDGSQVAYDFKSQRGRVNIANTVISKSYYHGELIKKYAKDVMYIENGRFTSCDKADPDYYFQSSKMKLIVNDRIIAEPIILYVDGVPVFALPFGVFPARSGRRSGIITPSFGENQTYGRYLSHFGYFWAINDYSDLTTTADWWTRGSYDLKSGFRYNARYYFQGSVYGSYSYMAIGQPGDPTRSVEKNWSLVMTHEQTLDPNTQLVANVSMSSQDYYKATALDYADLLNQSQNLVSNVSLTRTWPEAGNSMTLNLHRDQNLQNGSITANLPNISFSHGQSYPFRSAAHANTPLDQLAWYELIGYSYNGQFENNTSKLADTSSSTGFDRFNTYGASHLMSISASPKIGFFTLSPFVSITDKMYGSKTILHSVPDYRGTDSLVAEKINGFNNIGYFSTGLTINTRLFGIMQPNLFGITAFRHTLQPSITVSYQPDFSKSFWGYYGTYDSLNGNPAAYNFYGSQPYIFGGAPQGEFGGMTFSLSNNFEMKTKSSDTSQTENKIQLLNLGMNMSYNFLARGYNLPLSELNVNYRTNIAGKVDIGGTSTFNFYQYDYAAGRRINKLLLSEGQVADMTNFTLSFSTSFQGKKTQRQSTPQPGEEDSVQSEQQYNRFYQQIQPPDLSIPWNLRLGFSFGVSRPAPATVSRNANLQFDLGFNLTENWKIGFTGGYDFIQHDVVVPAVTVYRDLHCWEMTLRWNPIGYLRGFNLEIRIKAPQLRDVKITKREYQNIGF
jgi:lipopolysaccharide assembly outer membrane protein LptD (OstA)